MSNNQKRSIDSSAEEHEKSKISQSLFWRGIFDGLQECVFIHFHVFVPHFVIAVSLLFAVGSSKERFWSFAVCFVLWLLGWIITYHFKHLLPSSAQKLLGRYCQGSGQLGYIAIIVFIVAEGVSSKAYLFDDDGFVFMIPFAASGVWLGHKMNVLSASFRAKYPNPNRS